MHLSQFKGADIILYDRQVSVMLRKYGERIVIIQPDGGRRTAYGFIQPVRYKAKNYYEADKTLLGNVDGGVYQLIATPEAHMPDIAENYSAECGGVLFSVVRAEDITFGGETIYCRAIIKRCYREGEAEYELC